ncbi:MAG: hypothetical protein MK105_04630 [Crocinitomicaceae bacterium]|nr:hypothetical protein [Crocinitomicaceae bacterium]
MNNEIKTTGNAEEIFKNTEFNRFGLISAILMIVGCLGGLTIGMGAIEQVWMITLVVIPTMTIILTLSGSSNEIYNSSCKWSRFNRSFVFILLFACLVYNPEVQSG